MEMFHLQIEFESGRSLTALMPGQYSGVVLALLFAQFDPTPWIISKQRRLK